MKEDVRDLFRVECGKSFDQVYVATKNVKWYDLINKFDLNEQYIEYLDIYEQICSYS